MLLEFIATVAAGFAGAGVVLGAGALTRRTLPRWAAPAAAGSAMLAFAVWNEASWFQRTAEALPEGVVVIEQVSEPSWLRPWSYVAPSVNRFAAVDAAGLRRNAAVPDQVVVELYFWERFVPPSRLPAVIDCAGARRASLVDGAFDAEGRVVDPDWHAMDRGGALFRAVCPTA